MGNVSNESPFDFQQFLNKSQNGVQKCRYAKGPRSARLLVLESGRRVLVPIPPIFSLALLLLLIALLCARQFYMYISVALELTCNKVV
jgi:hypothetical protein